METPLSAALDEIAETHARLDLVDTELSTLIAEIETALRRHLNVRVAVPWRAGKLVFGKLDGKWSLLRDDGEENTPLRSCPRDARAAAFADGAVEALILGASAQIEESIAVRKAAIFTGQRLLRALAEEGSERAPPTR